MGTCTVSVIVATYGDESWRDRGAMIAVPSAVEAIEDLGAEAEIVTVHGDDKTLAYVRNEGADRAVGEWLCFLDADDELEVGYLRHLVAADGDLRAPAVRYVTGVGPIPDPVTFETRDMAYLNPCVIGTLIRRSTFHDVGGFWEEAAWEDWSMFRRAWLAGATITHTPAAVYRANTAPDGRNSTIANRPRLYRDILRSHAAWRRTKGLT